MFAMWEFEEDSSPFISFSFEVNKRSNGSGIRQKAIPQMLSHCSRNYVSKKLIQFVTL